MHIGLIGGIGPAATIAYYTKLIAAFDGAELPLALTMTHADIKVLNQNASANRTEDQAEVFASHLYQLAAAGCDVALITALTGHFCFEETLQRSPLPLINGIDVIDRYCAGQDIKTLGLLGSPTVLKSKLFGRLNASTVVVPQEDIDGLGQTYMELAQTGACTTENRSKFFKAGEAMIEEQNAEAVLLAGTDLGLAFNGYTPGFRVIDALDLHVQEILTLAKQS